MGTLQKFYLVTLRKFISRHCVLEQDSVIFNCWPPVPVIARTVKLIYDCFVHALRKIFVHKKVYTRASLLG